MAQIPKGRLVKGPKINQFVGTARHLLFNDCISMLWNLTIFPLWYSVATTQGSSRCHRRCLRAEDWLVHPPKQTWNLKMGAPWKGGDSELGNHHFQVNHVEFQSVFRSSGVVMEKMHRCKTIDVGKHIPRFLAKCLMKFILTGEGFLPWTLWAGYGS